MLSHAIPEKFAGTHNFPIIKWHQYFNIKRYKPAKFATAHVHNGAVGSGETGKRRNRLWGFLGYSAELFPIMKTEIVSEFSDFRSEILQLLPEKIIDLYHRENLQSFTKEYKYIY